MAKRRVVVIGGGVAGFHVVRRLRELGYDDELVLIERQHELPYDRPPLTKEYLLGQASAEKIFFTGATWFVDHRVDWVGAQAAVGIYPAEHRVRLASGSEIPFDQLVLAVGLEARRWVMPTPANVFVVRTLGEAWRLRCALLGAQNVVIVGAGFIGLEVAAACRSCGLAVAVVDIAPRAIPHAASERVSRWIVARHEARGVSFYFRESVKRWLGGPDRAVLELESGIRLAGDVVVLGLGTTPNPLLQELVPTDPSGRTQWPDVWAAGDCSTWNLPQGPVHVEHWDAAYQQAEVVAHNLLSSSPLMRWHGMSYVWTTQYDWTIHMFGQVTPETRVRGHADDYGFVEWYLRGDRVVGAAVVNQPRLTAACRRVVMAQHKWHPALADPATSIGAALTPTDTPTQ